MPKWFQPKPRANDIQRNQRSMRSSLSICKFASFAYYKILMSNSESLVNYFFVKTIEKEAPCKQACRGLIWALWSDLIAPLIKYLLLHKWPENDRTLALSQLFQATLPYFIW